MLVRENSFLFPEQLKKIIIINNILFNEYSSYLSNSLIKNDVRTKFQGRSQILPNGDLFIEETNSARTLFFNSDGSLRWTHVNRSDKGGLYNIRWSRILYNNDDIQIVKNFLLTKDNCND